MQRTTVTCANTTCLNESHTRSPFMLLSVTHKDSIEEGLKEYTEESHLDTSYTCDKCKLNTFAKVKHAFIKMPKVFVLHIKRFNQVQ